MRIRLYNTSVIISFEGYYMHDITDSIRRPNDIGPFEPFIYPIRSFTFKVFTVRVN